MNLKKLAEHWQPCRWLIIVLSIFLPVVLDTLSLLCHLNKLVDWKCQPFTEQPNTQTLYVMPTLTGLKIPWLLILCILPWVLGFFSNLNLHIAAYCLRITDRVTVMSGSSKEPFMMPLCRSARHHYNSQIITKCLCRSVKVAGSHLDSLCLCIILYVMLSGREHLFLHEHLR